MIPCMLRTAKLCGLPHSATLRKKQLTFTYRKRGIWDRTNAVSMAGAVIILWGAHEDPEGREWARRESQIVGQMIAWLLRGCYHLGS